MDTNCSETQSDSLADTISHQLENSLSHYSVDPTDSAVARSILFHLYEAKRTQARLTLSVRRDLARLFGVTQFHQDLTPVVSQLALVIRDDRLR